MKTLEILKSVAREGRNNAVDLIRRKLDHPVPPSLAWRSRELTMKGFTVVPNFMSLEECHAIKSWMDEVIGTNPKVWKDAKESDHRVYFANKGFDKVNRFFNNEMITDIISEYEKTSNYTGFTLANKLLYKENNAGSGGGWHRDYVKRKQTKAILYLSDVTEQSGPFQFLTGTNRFTSVVKFQKEFGFKYNQSRFSDDQINAVTKVYPELLSTLTGGFGTLILVDTRGIHRGRPIEAGTRYALTNYYWFSSGMPAGLFQKLDPFE